MDEWNIDYPLLYKGRKYDTRGLESTSMATYSPGRHAFALTVHSVQRDKNNVRMDEMSEWTGQSV